MTKTVKFYQERFLFIRKISPVKARLVCLYWPLLANYQHYQRGCSRGCIGCIGGCKDGRLLNNSSKLWFGVSGNCGKSLDSIRGKMHINYPMCCVILFSDIDTDHARHSQPPVLVVNIDLCNYWMFSIHASTDALLSAHFSRFPHLPAFTFGLLIKQCLINKKSLFLLFPHKGKSVKGWTNGCLKGWLDNL